TELEAYFKMLEEAKRRDHRKIGAEMGLYAIDTEYVGPGLPLWLPKGAAIAEELEKLAKETEFQAGYVRVKTPHIAKEKLYLTSGHLPLLYKESMYPPMEFVEEENRNRLVKIEIRKRELDKALEGKESGHVWESDVAFKERAALIMEERQLCERYYLKAMNCPHHHRIFAAQPRSYRDLPL